MSLFNMFGDPFGDAIFGTPMRAMHQEMNMMLQDPFAGLLGGMNIFERNMSPHSRMSAGRSIMPYGYPMFNPLMEGGGNNCHSFSTSTVMTMSTGPDGRPMVYKESQSTRLAPGGVKETKRSVCDSRTGTKRIAIGHHLGERGHVKERIQHIHNGEQEETDELLGVEEDEVEAFDREWERRARAVDRRGPQISAIDIGNDSDDDTNDYSRKRSRPLAITAPPSSCESSTSSIGHRKKSTKSTPYEKPQRSKR